MYLGGFTLPLLGGLGMFFFSISVFFNVALAFLWIYLELCGLCLIPLFFFGGFCSSMSGLFYYIVFSGISSSLILMGLLLPECVFFLFCGFLLKFGIFPVWGWVYRVCSGSGWPVIWGFSTVLKMSFFLLPLFLVFGLDYSGIPLFLCCLSFLCLSPLFWIYCYDWKLCWSHMMLSSSSLLVGLGLSGCSLVSLFFLFFIYFFWASSCLVYLSVLSETGGFTFSGWGIFFYSFLLLAFPLSFAVFYKAFSCFCVFSCGIFLLVCWCIYSISEQFYLFFFLTGLSGHGPSDSSLCFI